MSKLNITLQAGICNWLSIFVELICFVLLYDKNSIPNFKCKDSFNTFKMLIWKCS